MSCGEKLFWAEGCGSDCSIDMDAMAITIHKTCNLTIIIVVGGKEIKMILRLFLVIAMYCQGSSSQKNQSLNLALLAGWERRLGICSR